MPDVDTDALIQALATELPSVVRWSGAVARRMREFNIAVEGKSSGYSNTDALTLADLSVQELLVAALRDGSPLFRQCRIEGEESTGDMALFPEDSDLAITIDPIDGTKQYRDRTANGYSVIVQLQTPDDVLYSLVYLPEGGPTGSWVEVYGDRIVCVPDDTSRKATDVLKSATSCVDSRAAGSNKVYMIGFLDRDPERAQMVNDAGLEGVLSDDMPTSVYPLQATGEFTGSLIHSPNIYDFPVSMQIARMLGGDAVWVHNREPVNFHELWLDERSNMLRIQGIVACSERQEVLDTLCDVAQDWSPHRYDQ